MGQVTIYLDDEAEKRVRAEARKSRLSVSRWIARTIAGRVQKEWPSEARELAGAWADFPDLAELRAAKGKDHPRVRF